MARFGLPWVVASVGAVSGVCAEQRWFQAQCAAASKGGAPSCSVIAGKDSGADAVGFFVDDIDTIGWGKLLIRTPSSEPGIHAFAAGYLEGYLTAGLTAKHVNNTLVGSGMQSPAPGVAQFMEASDAWWGQQVAKASPGDAYWAAAAFLRGQFDGLLAGTNERLRADGSSRRISRAELYMANSIYDVDDIKQAVNQAERPKFEEMDAEAVTLWTRQHGHCSALVKLVPDGSELYIGHNTWEEYWHMLRIFKRYEFGSLRPVAMPSYPGTLYSGDDFYQMGDLVVMETTLPNYNPGLLDLVKPDTLLFWIRAMVANMLATNGTGWMQAFQRHNSGTYNNMWMVVDYSRFEPRKPLREGLFTVGEQLPGYFHFDDQTVVLSYGYWPSYNAAFYPETSRLIQQDIMTEKRGNEFSYQFVSRAQIFRRDQGEVVTDEDMRRILRYNRFQQDPIAKGDACKQLACRSDLAATPMGFGAVDAKYMSAALVRADRMAVVSGPTHDDQTPFVWSAAPASVQEVPHEGQPDKQAFGWVAIGADLAAVPLGDSSRGIRSDVGLPVFGMAVGGAIAMASFAVFACLRAHGRTGGTPDSAPATGYKALAASPAFSQASTAFPTGSAASPLPPSASPA